MAILVHMLLCSVLFVDPALNIYVSIYLVYTIVLFCLLAPEINLYVSVSSSLLCICQGGVPLLSTFIISSQYQSENLYQARNLFLNNIMAATNTRYNLVHLLFQNEGVLVLS